MKTQWIAILAALLVLAGCDGTGGVGGQGISINVHFAESSHDNAANTSIDINDGGTALLSDPSAAGPAAEPTTRPVRSVQSSQDGQ